MNNDDNQNGTQERAQVGIGTLIVFIAMVLVAAIAAGVLINTAGFLQTQAEDTGTESTEQVADAINVITEVGEVGNNDEIHNVRVGVQPAAGADEINLAELTVQYVSDENFTNLVVAQDESQSPMKPSDDDFGDKRAAGDTDPRYVNPQAWDEGPNGEGDQRYGIDVITAENEDDLVMTENSDRYEIVINTSGLEWANTDSVADGGVGNFIGPLNEGVDVELTITNEVGSQTVAFMSVPDTLSDQEDGDTVNL
jgi:flagellin FlaB